MVYILSYLALTLLTGFYLGTRANAEFGGSGGLITAVMLLNTLLFLPFIIVAVAFFWLYDLGEKVTGYNKVP